MEDYTPQKEAVILLHGIGHNGYDMFPLYFALKKKGYRPFRIHYPSTKMTLADLTIWLEEKLNHLRIWNDFSKIHFVAHSMGGLLTASYLDQLKKKDLANSTSSMRHTQLGHVVMLGTPHGGSEVTDKWQNFWLYKKVFGVAGQELTTSARQGLPMTAGNSLSAPSATPDAASPSPSSKGKSSSTCSSPEQNQDLPCQTATTPLSKDYTIYYKLGIVAGTQNWMYPLCNHYFNGQPNDGCVSVKNTQIDQMSDHICVPSNHCALPWRKFIHTHVIYFLENGAFDHGQ